MNPILEKWLTEKQTETKKSREIFLIKQGLVDPSKTTTVYKDIYGNIITEEEAKQKKIMGIRVVEQVTNAALDLTDEEYNQVLTYANPNISDYREPTDHELLKQISRRTGIISAIMVVSVVLSVIAAVIVYATI